MRVPYRQATENMNTRISEPDAVIGQVTETYCCPPVPVHYGAILALGSFNHQEQRVRHAIRQSRNRRQGNNHWKRFPFYYTLLQRT